MRSLVFVLLMAMVFQIPWEVLVALGRFGTLIRAIGMGAAFLGFVAIFTTGRFRGPLPLHYMMALFVSFGLLSLLWTQDGEATIGKCITFGQLLAFVWLIWEFAPDAFRQRLLLHAYIWGGGLAIFLQLLGLRAVVAATPDEERYAAGTMNVNEFAITLLMSIPMAIYFATDGKTNRLMRIAYLAYCPVCALSLLLTGSRMALVVACAMGAMIGIVYLIKRPVFTISVSILGGAVFLYLFTRIMPEATWERLSKTAEELQTGTWSGRTKIWDAGLVIFQQNPVLGTGSGTFSHVIGQVIGTGGMSEASAHNAFVSVMVELGAVGLLLFLAMIIVAGIYTFKIPFRERYTWRIILTGWGLTACAANIEAGKLLWFILAMIACQYATLMEKGIAKVRAEPLGSLGPGRQLLVRPRYGNTRGM